MGKEFRMIECFLRSWDLIWIGWIVKKESTDKWEEIGSYWIRSLLDQRTFMVGVVHEEN